MPGHGSDHSSLFPRKRSAAASPGSSVTSELVWTGQNFRKGPGQNFRNPQRQNRWASLEFFNEVKRAFPFPIRRWQSDNGAEFPLMFSLTVQEAGIQYRYITPRRPEQNGKVERSHRTDQEEFWSRHTFVDFEAAVPARAAWERHYNYDRFSLALQGRTPAEKLALHLPAAQLA
jgi:transposase InsO family protein